MASAADFAADASCVICAWLGRRWHMTSWWKRFAHMADYGATTVEYALMAMLIALVVIAGVTLIGTSLSSFFADAATKI